MRGSSERFGRILETSARAVLGQLDRVELEPVIPASPARTDSVVLTTVPSSPIETLNPRYSFDQFIIGDGNRLAHAAALAVAELPGQAYNPLFLHAPPGLGKTHLLHAIGNYVLAFGGGATVRYATVEAFTNHFIHALGSRSLDHFKHAYRDADVLLIDDVQFLASKAKTEEEFFHTFNALYETGRQLVLTCDRLPRQLSTVEERLRERFESGLVADIRPPDFATRVTILRKRAVLDRITVADDDVLDADRRAGHRQHPRARRRADPGRRLPLADRRVQSTGELATDVLDDIVSPEPRRRRSSIADIQAAVAARYGITVAELVSASRAARVAWPRQVAIHLARELTDASLQRNRRGVRRPQPRHRAPRLQARLRTCPHRP